MEICHKLLVNPWNYRQCADAIKSALEMSPAEQKLNWDEVACLMDLHFVGFSESLL
jgi:trehalose-6-phosphate synthase